MHWTLDDAPYFAADPGSERPARGVARELDLAAEEARAITVTLHPEILGRPHRVRPAAPRPRPRSGSRHPGADARGGRYSMPATRSVTGLPEPAREPDHRAQLRVAPPPLEPRDLGRVHLGGRRTAPPASSRRPAAGGADSPRTGPSGPRARMLWPRRGRTPGPEPQVAANRAGSGASRDARAGARSEASSFSSQALGVRADGGRRDLEARRDRRRAQALERSASSTSSSRGLSAGPSLGPADADLGGQRRLRLRAQRRPAARDGSGPRTGPRRATPAREHAGGSMAERVPRDGTRVGVEERPRASARASRA